jgi:integrase
MGRIYQQPGSAKYYLDFIDGEGRRQRVSARTTDYEVAKRKLKDVEGRVARAERVLPHAEGLKYEHLAADLRAHYAATGARDLVEAGRRLAHLDRFFKQVRAVAIDRPLITRYIQHRQQEGASNGTIRQEFAVLGRMLNLAVENKRLLHPVALRGLKPQPAKPRQGFFEPGQFAAVVRHLPPDLQVAVAVSYTFGWRMQSEVLTLERRQLDLDAGTLRLEPGSTKNDDARVVYLTPELRTLLEAQRARVEALQKRLGRIVPFLFPFLTGAQRVGARRQDFRKAWRRACRRAGVPGALRHDFRRTAVRNMVNAGVPERVAMTVTGHKTRAVFDRYHIVSPGDLQAAAGKLRGIVSGIVSPARQKPVAQVGNFSTASD